MFTETGLSAEGIPARWDKDSIPDFPRTGSECVYYLKNSETYGLITGSCSQEHLALCVYDNHVDDYYNYYPDYDSLF